MSGSYFLYDFLLRNVCEPGIISWPHNGILASIWYYHIHTRSKGKM